MADILDGNKNTSSTDPASSAGMSASPGGLTVDPTLLRPGADAPQSNAATPKADDLPSIPVPADVGVIPVEPKPDPAFQSAGDNLIVPEKKPPAAPPPAGAKKSNKRNVAIGLAAIFLLVSTGLAFVFVTNQQSVGDIRNRAEGELYPVCEPACGAGFMCVQLPGTSSPGCRPIDQCQGTCVQGFSCVQLPGTTSYGCRPNGSPTPIHEGCNLTTRRCTGGQVCHCQDGDACTRTRCEDPDETMNSCVLQGRSWCTNYQGFAMTCCVAGYTCSPNFDGCIPGGGSYSYGQSSYSSYSYSESSYQTVTPQCNSIKVYKNGTVVTPSTLRPGDAVVIAVAGGNATKARIRINGSAFTETTIQNSADEYTLDYTIPTGQSTFTIEGEIFGVDGQWH